MTVTNSPFLRATLIADAVMGFAAAAITIFGAGLLSAWLALPEGLLFWAGVALVPIAAFLLMMAFRPEIPRSWLREIVFINASWTVASLAILLLGLVQPNMLGAAFVIVQAVAVGASRGSRPSRCGGRIRSPPDQARIWSSLAAISSRSRQASFLCAGLRSR